MFVYLVIRKWRTIVYTHVPHTCAILLPYFPFKCLYSLPYWSSLINELGNGGLHWLFEAPSSFDLAPIQLANLGSNSSVSHFTEGQSFLSEMRGKSVTGNNSCKLNKKNCYKNINQLTVVMTKLCHCLLLTSKWFCKLIVATTSHHLQSLRRV